MKANDLLQAYRNGLSDKARSNFDSDIRQWSAWRGQHAAFVAATPEQVREFVIHCATTGFARGLLSHTSIGHILTSIASLHTKVLSAPDPTKSIIVKSEIKRLRQQTGTNQVQVIALRSEDDVLLPRSNSASKHRISIPSITRLKEACDIQTPRGMRDRALLGIGQDLGRRNRDFHLFNDSDFTRRPDGRGHAFMTRSKTDQRGEGKLKIISSPTMGDIEAWVGWKGENETDAGQALLLSINQTGRVGNRLSTSGINYALRHVVADAILADNPSITREIALEVAQQVSSHSFRVGLAQDGVAANKSANEIRDQGDWSQDKRVLAYARNLDPSSGAVARLRSLVPLS